MERMVDERGQDEELAALATEARGGSDAAFDKLARRIRDRVRRWAEGITRDSDDADDVAQQVLLRLHRRIDQFEGRSRFTTWLYRMTRNLAFNRVHRDRHRSELLARRVTEIGVSGEDDADETNAAADRSAELAELVQFFLAELPERQRAAFELCDLRGFNSTEIAKRLDITPSTARGLLMKARRRIRLRILESHAHLLEDYTP
jgi:RNA polymerase sigma-70 factor (ECF subfamily)